MAGFKMNFGGVSILLILALGMALLAAAAPTLLGPDILLWGGLLLGLAIGIMNISGGESLKFMVAYIAITATSAFLASIPSVGVFLHAFFAELLIIFGVATFLIAFKVIFKITKK